MSYSYQVQLRDTDAAGVVYFANLLAICHGAYESSLASAGIDLRKMMTNPATALPIIHASINFQRPIYCGDHLQITLTPTYQSSNEFSVDYQICLADGQVAGQAWTRHVSIDPHLRRRSDLPPQIQDWIVATASYSR
jgi:1,4-dihydroxy-2-naphthoyl-CoA hydrolase